MAKLKNEKVFAKGGIYELIHIEQTDGRIFEIARRAPGVRLIISNRDTRKILLTKEFRHEIGGWDYRLPGGKVFDKLDEYNEFLQSGADIIEVAKQKAVAESSEETGITVNDLRLFKKSILGATVEWDLFVFDVIDWAKSDFGQHLEVGEDIQADNWFTYEETAAMILNGEMQEERIALVLLQWIRNQDRDKHEI